MNCTSTSIINLKNMANVIGPTPGYATDVHID